MQRSVFYHKGHPRDYTLLRRRLRQLAGTRVRYGYRRHMVLLRRECINNCHNAVYQIYPEENLGVKRRKRRKRAANTQTTPEPGRRVNERWSMDFVTDRLEPGRAFRVLTLIDQYTRECLAPLEPGVSLKGRNVVESLEGVRAERPLPESITVDNGREFAGRVLDAWAYLHHVKLDFIRPGRPVESGFIESFNGKLRDECLNAEVLLSIADAREKLERWRHDYNHLRPHSSLSNRPPAEFAREPCGNQKPTV